MPAPTKKRPRKPNKNPDIEALLVLKDKWNLDVSSLIFDLIALKRGLNGRGDAEHQLRPSRVTDHLDDAIPSLLGELGNKYHEIASEGMRIVQEQNNLSTERVKHKQDHNPGSQPSVATSPGVLPLAASINLQLVSEGTSALSRTWFKIKGPFSRSLGRKTLEGILYTFLDIKHDLEDLQDAAVSTDAEASQRLSDSFVSFNKNLQIVNSLYNQFLNEIGKSNTNTSEVISSYQAEYNRLKREIMIADSIQGTPHKFKTRFNNLSKLFEDAQNDIDRADIIGKIKSFHKEIISYYKQNYKTKIPGNWETISDFANLSPEVIPQENFADDKLQTLAHNIFTRFLKKKKLQISLIGDKFSGTKLSLYDTAAVARENVISAMNEIESGGDYTIIGSKIKDLKASFDDIRRLNNVLSAGKSK